MMYLGNQAIGMVTSLPVFADIVKIEIGEYTPTEDEAANEKLISHSLGVMPDFIICTSYGLDTSITYNHMCLISAHMIRTFNINAPTNREYQISAYRLNTNGTFGTAMASADQITLHDTLKITEATFCLTAYNNYMLKAGVTYKYIIGTFKEVTSNAS